MWLSGRPLKTKRCIYNTWLTCVTYCQGVLKKQWKKGHSGTLKQETGNTCRSEDSLRFRLSWAGQAKQRNTIPPLSYGASLFLSICDWSLPEPAHGPDGLTAGLSYVVTDIVQNAFNFSILEHAPDIN